MSFLMHVAPPVRWQTWHADIGLARISLRCPDCQFFVTVLGQSVDEQLPHLCVIDGEHVYRWGEFAEPIETYVLNIVPSFMTTSETDTVTISLHYRDAQRYARGARRPASPEVLSAIREALEANPWESRLTITVPVETARTFVRKSTRPMRLYTGQTMKSLLEFALAEYDEAHPADLAGPVEPDGTMTSDSDGFMSETQDNPDDIDNPYEDEADDDTTTTMDDVVDAPTEAAPEVHTDEPDQEPTPVAQEGTQES
jgi:hypothetical protein